jgi:hypothetical protein
MLGEIIIRNKKKIAAAAATTDLLVSGCNINAANNNQNQGDGLGSRATDTSNPTTLASSDFTMRLSPSPTVAPTPSVTPTSEQDPVKNPTSEPTRTQPSRTFNLYDSRGVRWQTFNACIGDSAQMMLNFAALAGSGDGWKVNTSTATEEAIETYALNHDVTPGNTVNSGSDPVGLREALNHYGFGGQEVYRINTFSSYNSALEGIVDSISKTRRPVAAFTYTGYHLIVVTGYKITNGEIAGVYVTDPLGSDGLNNAFIPASNWNNPKKIGTWDIFNAYLQKDGTLKDPLTKQTGKSELYGKWVIVSPTE